MGWNLSAWLMPVFPIYWESTFSSPADLRECSQLAQPIRTIHHACEHRAVTPVAVEAWARRGTAGDMLVLARIVACLDPASQGSLHRCAATAVAAQRGAQVDASACDSHHQQADALARAIEVLEAYGALHVDGKATVLGVAVELVAAMRLRSAGAKTDFWEDEDHWLRALANDTYPHGDDVARLLSHAKGVDPCWDEALFPDGPQAVVVVPSECEIAEGAGILAGYSFIQSSTGAFYRPPYPAEHFGINVPQSDFKEWDGEDLVLDRDKWEAAVQDATVLRFAEFVAEWRASFFEELILGRQPLVR